jgi:hypothetical protein
MRSLDMGLMGRPVCARDPTPAGKTDGSGIGTGVGIGIRRLSLLQLEEKWMLLPHTIQTSTVAN